MANDISEQHAENENPVQPHKVLRQTLRALDITKQRLLACDYVEHVAWLCTSGGPFEEFLVGAYINACRQFVLNVGSVEHVAAEQERFNAVLFDTAVVKPFGSVTAAEAVNDACVVCCRENLVALGLYSRNDRIVKCYDVARSCSFAVALHYAGDDWYAENEAVQSAARERGRAESVKETVWQLEKARAVFTS